ncbi:MAG: hypothetical protein K0Q59_148 [Paenibacillus sp.]|nr:hypothetical protein [Paenibacillus sp.]
MGYDNVTLESKGRMLMKDNYTKLERNHPTPLYEQLKQIIEQQIQEGKLEPGEQIPSERELCEKFDVSRVTVRQALALAVNEGLLYRTHGRGTFVADNARVEQPLSELNSFQDSWAKQGLIASTEIIRAETLPNDLYLSRLLNVKMSEQIMNLQLLGSGDGRPVVYYNSYFPYEIGSVMAERAQAAKQAGKPFSTLDLYAVDEAWAPTHVDQTFEAAAADETVAHMLQIAVGSPYLLVTSIVYSGERSLEYKAASYKADRYKFFITRKYTP